MAEDFTAEVGDSAVADSVVAVADSVAWVAGLAAVAGVVVGFMAEPGSAADQVSAEGAGFPGAAFDRRTNRGHRYLKILQSFGREDRSGENGR